jgi:alpha-1,4-digalacturonate transport system permease protein
MVKAVYSAIMNILGVPFELLQRFAHAELMPYAFLFPNLLLMSVFTLLPVLLNFYYSFTGGSNPFLQDRPFVGLQNYQQILDCQNFLDSLSCREDLFWSSVPKTAAYVFWSVTFTLIFSLITALVLNRPIRGRGFFRSVFFYPVMLSPVVVALIWRWLLIPEGLVNGILANIGLPRVDFLTSADWATFWVIFIGVWSTMGFYTLIVLAGLQSIPKELYEAAQVDGASRWRTFRQVTFPLVSPTLLVVLVLVTIRSVQVFDHVYAFTNGGPGTATHYLVQYIVEKGFTIFPGNFGMAATASVFIAVVLVVITLVQLRLSREAQNIY